MATERLAPDAILAQTDLSGSVTAIQDDPDSPDASWLTASSNNVDTSVRTSFPTPSGTLTTGAGVQNFRALVRKSVGSGTGTPTARIELWENGSLVSAGSSVSVTSLTGQVISYTWDASGRTAANIEALVFGTKTGGSPTVRASVDVGAVEWNADYTAAATPKSGTDTATVGATDTATIAGSSTHTDTATVGATEATTLAGSSSQSDTTAVGITEAVNLAAVLAASDTASVGVTESTAVEISQAILAGDTVSVGVTETTSVLVTVEPSDTAAASIAEAVEILSTVATSDTATIGATEAVALLNSFSATDALSVTADEAISIIATLAASDDVSVSVVDTASVVPEEGEAEPKAASDTASVAITDTASLAVVLDSLAASDSVSLAITEGAVIVAFAGGGNVDGGGYVIVVEGTRRNFATESSSGTSGIEGH